MVNFNDFVSSPFKTIVLQLLSSYDREEFNQIVLKESMRIFSTEGSILFIYDQESKAFSTEKKEGITTSDLKEAKLLFKKLLAEDRLIESTCVTIEQEPGFLSFIPVFQKQDSITVLVLKTPQLLPEKSQDFLSDFVELLKIAFEGLRTQTNVLRKSEGHKMMSKLHQLIGLGSFEEILSEVVQRIGVLLQTTTVGIMLYDEETNELVLQKPAFGVWNDELINKYRIPLERGGNAISVFLTGVPTRTNDAFKEKHYLHEFLTLFGDDKAVLTVPLSVHSKRIGVLHAGKSVGGFTDDDLDVLMDISHHLGLVIDGAIQMQSSSATLLNRKEVESFIKRRLLQGVLKGDSRDVEHWLMNGQLLRLPVLPPFIAIAIELSHTNHESFDWPEDQIESLERLVKKTLPIAGFTIDENRLLIVCTYEKDRNWMIASKGLKMDLTQFMTKYWMDKPFSIAIGFGSTVATLNQLDESYKRARQVLKYATHFPDQIGFHSEMAAWTLLSEVSVNQKEIAQEFVETHLKSFNALKRQDDLKKTLECYLMNERHIKNTADELFIHPNTLRFRIEKIEKETNLDLSNAETRLNLLLAFRLEKLL